MSELDEILKGEEGVETDTQDLITEAEEVRLTAATPGWQIIKQELDSAIADYEVTIEESGSMEQTYGAAKTLSGMKFVFKVIENILEDGIDAVENLNKK